MKLVVTLKDFSEAIIKGRERERLKGEMILLLSLYCRNKSPRFLR